ncbi:7-deoxyloganetic acid glucosyltransferase-like [Diospyros lotus]|uniref:7-deoxyloganetic acid glucosyltransferase-like n=1 Tax=Diospyros lotus TaxID=55363 RepID=UPI00225462F7|nr:7-deoxyloganetic acid glucosyltransferase-like [Diospyros lotus]
MAESSSHVLIFPFPVQGHVKCMLQLAELLCLSGIPFLTFLNSDHNHRRLLLDSHFLASFPGFRFASLPDGLPPDHPRSGIRIFELFDSISAVTKPLFRDMLLCGRLNCDGRPPVNCIIADGIFMSFAIDVAEEVGIPLVSFRTFSASCFWTFLCIPRLIQAGDLPIRGDDDDMGRAVSSVPGMESFLRFCDLPSFCRAADPSDRALQIVATETHLTTRAHALILNTFDELEGSALSHIRRHIPNLYAVGPLGAFLHAKLPESSRRSSTSLWQEDRTCMAWLDARPPKSVVYVSFGSITVLTRDQLLEFWYGLVNSGKPFLWVDRPNSVAGEQQVPKELAAATRERGYVVGWAPQEEVLAHPAIGGFLTHSGWNSTLESLVAGVPMICWPYFGDQQMNSRFVGEVWKVGVDMKDCCDRVIVEKMIRDVMEVRREEVEKSAMQMAETARKAVAGGGSSRASLDRLVEDIKLMTGRRNATQ